MNSKLRHMSVLILCGFVSVSVASHAAGKGSAKPRISFATNKIQVESGEGVMLSWMSTHTRFCLAAGGWSGKLDTQGVWRSKPIASDQRFEIKCATETGWLSRSVTVRVNRVSDCPAESKPETKAETKTETKSISKPKTEAAPEPKTLTAPDLNLDSSVSSVAYKSSVELTWVAADADKCVASGAWSGLKKVYGVEKVGPITRNSTFNLACSGAGGTSLEMLSVQVASQLNASAKLTWAPPKFNEDGSLLDGLSGYVIYYGAASKRYSEHTEVGSDRFNSYDLALAPGTYYVAMRAVGLNGELSGLSNEIQLEVP